jgi:hypothetical protein
VLTSWGGCGASVVTSSALGLPGLRPGDPTISSGKVDKDGLSRRRSAERSRHEAGLRGSSRPNSRADESQSISPALLRSNRTSFPERSICRVTAGGRAIPHTAAGALVSKSQGWLTEQRGQAVVIKLHVRVTRV